MNEELSVLAEISSKPLGELSKEEMARLIIREKRALLQLASDTLDIFLGISYKREAMVLVAKAAEYFGKKRRG